MLYYYRTHLDKDNVIVKDSTINLGKNPVAELFYGGTQENPIYSRYILHFDESDLKSLYDNCYLGDLTKTSHTLKLKPIWYFGDAQDRCLASSYTLCISKINQDWTEGCGYLYDCKGGCEQLLPLKCNATHSASNWLMADSETEWATDGVFDNLSGNTVACTTIDCENEIDDYLEFDLTDEVNNMLSGGQDNYGYIIHLSANFENFPENETKYLGFYTKDTDTYFQPFLETKYEHHMEDDRYNFILGKDNNIYLHAFAGSDAIVLDNAPDVEIFNQSEVSLYSGTSKCVSKGIYEAVVNFSGTVEDCQGLFTDKWSGLSKEGVSINDYEDQIEPFNINNHFSFNQEVYESPKYGFKFRGIKYNEVITKGERRKIFIDLYEAYSLKNKIPVDNVEYKLFVKQGEHELNIIDWSKANLSLCDNWFYLDTSWMIPQTYYLSLKIEKNEEISIYPQEIKFSVQ